MDQDETDPMGAVSSGSTLFVIEASQSTVRVKQTMVPDQTAPYGAV